jgi:uncharacterized protein (TIGR02391 family)
MNRTEAIEKLKEALEEIPKLKKLQYDNEEFKEWQRNVTTIAKYALGSDDYKTVTSPKLSTIHLRGEWTDDYYQEDFLKELSGYERDLKSIIQKYEILGMGTGPVTASEPERIRETTTDLFDKMQFHPKVIKVSKSLFETGHYAPAIFEAFKAVNNFVKEKTSLSQDGKALMSKVFNENNPVIKLNELSTVSDKDEQEGFKFLFMGAMVGIRNPKAHDNIVQTDPYRTLEYLSFASLLMRRAEEGKG